ncbi:uncharacterized protein [Clytia hemisphaerica]|uniref:MD-2-related lipid-recognition domain-containing protein n=1 Tax=Clytia hemisphaerica TaxID=252671 RepID=A0A7M5UY37_9CNID|eukprot:TCONS_00064845-protein
MSCELLKIVLFLGLATFSQCVFKLENCDKTAPVQYTLLKAPDYLVLRNNGNIKLSASIKVKSSQSLPRHLRMKISLSKRIGFVWIDIPCVGCDIKVDTFTIPEIRTIRRVCSQNCTLTAEDIVFPLSSHIEEYIPGIFPNMLLEGHFYIKMDMVDESNHKNRVVCVKGYTDVKTS